MLKLLAIVAAFPYIFTHVLAHRPRQVEVDASLTLNREVGVGQWIAVLTGTRHRRFFSQLLDDLDRRTQCAEIAKGQWYEKKYLALAQTVGDKCPVVMKGYGKTEPSFEDKTVFQKCGGFCFPVARQYDYSHSTEENYRRGKDILQHEEPLYSKIWTVSVVRDLDHEYHALYTSVRSAWQKYWIEKVLYRAPLVDELHRPWIIFTSGAMGVGKGYVMKWMSDQGYFNLEDVVHVDPDFFKSVMPEKDGYIKKNFALAATNCHRESGTMMELAVRKAMASRLHIWEDGSLRDAGWYGQRFKDIKGEDSKGEGTKVEDSGRGPRKGEVGSSGRPQQKMREEHSKVSAKLR